MKPACRANKQLIENFCSLTSRNASYKSGDPKTPAQVPQTVAHSPCTLTDSFAAASYSARQIRLFGKKHGAQAPYILGTLSELKFPVVFYFFWFCLRTASVSAPDLTQVAAAGWFSY